jgi:WD40 repeat protein
MEPGSAAANPYAGPRPFTEAQSRLFFGRDRETADLYSLVVSHRVVLLYAASGAGKTSLLHAGLLPRLRGRYRILGPARVSGLVPAGVSEAAIANVYAFHVLQSWAAQEPEGDAPDRRALALARMTLAQFLGLAPAEAEERGADRRRGAPTVLIMDQLEEIFRLYPERWADRAAFFEQLRDVVEWGPHVRILLAMREDWIAELDPYTRLFWDRLHVRFRLECLRRPQALAAVTEPLALLTEGPCRFEPEAAEKLVTDLLTFRAVNAEGATVPVIGEFVEPVQLQVVCERLWQRLPAGTALITRADVEQLGDANAALGDFYVDCIREAARAAGVSDGVLRTRFAKAFIGPGQTRRMVPREQGASGVEGVPGRALDALEARLLVRRESRGAHTWYELSHDRFVDPIARSNEAYFQERGSAMDVRRRLEERASRWLASQRRDRSLLLAGRGELRRAEQWRQSPEAGELDVSPAVDELINASRMHLRARKLLVSYAVVIPLVLVALGVAYLGINRLMINALRAKAAEQTAAARALRLDANQRRDVATQRKAFAEKLTSDARRASLNAERVEQGAGPVESARERDRARVLEDEASRASAEAESASADAVRLDADTARVFNEAWQVRLSLDQGRWWEHARDLIKPPRPVKRPPDLVALADGMQDPEARLLVLLQALAAKPSDADVRRAIDRALEEALGPFEELTRLPHTTAVWGVAFHPNGRDVATASADGVARIWDAEAGQVRHRLDHLQRVNAVAFSPDGRRIATAGFDGFAQVWDLPPAGARGEPVQRCRIGARDRRVYHVAFDPGSNRIATGDEDGRARVWDVSSHDCREVGAARAHPASVFGVAFTPDGERLGTACADGMARIWDLKGGGPTIVLEGHRQQVFGIAFHPRRAEALTTGMDRTARVWDLATARATRVLEGHTAMLGTGAYSADGTAIVTTSADRSVRFWSADATVPHRVLKGHTAEVVGVAVAPDSRRFVTGSLDGTATVWRVRAVDPAGASREPASWGDLVERVRKRVTRELSPHECAQYLGTTDCPPPVKLP